uniref:Microtubule associated tumor suppressor 1a n=1 Tax=Astyanax mexicanus TaxID=7994 RepID=A0A8B9LIA1_ASTMX
MLFSPKFSLSNIHVKLTAKGLLRSLQLLSGCKKSTVVFRAVDKGKAKTTVRNHQQQQGQTNGHPDLVPPETKPRGVEYFKALCEKKNQTIQHLKNSLAVNNRKFEAITVVVQNLSAKHEEAVKRRQEISRELLSLREELVSSAQSCERLEQEKEDLRVTFDGVLQKVQEQHRSDLSDLEERLKTFYSAEWVKVHQTYQDEADKCKAQMEQQLEELRARHEDLKQELEVSHGQKVESLKQHYEETFEGDLKLRNSHELDMNTLKKKLNDAETTLSNQIEELTAENCSLSERLKVEEDRRKELADKCQDSHTLYLEQELESLKVVLDIKNKQIHQQDKKLMQMDKLLEKNVKIDECLKKVQQENEDLKARMDRHAALSRQLSTEQAVLQESLQKESKVNKRLSMENEELLWKLQNGDLSSPRKTSPSSPSITLQSPHNSGLFSSPPISPR